MHKLCCKKYAFSRYSSETQNFMYIYLIFLINTGGGALGLIVSAPLKLGGWKFWRFWL